MNRADNVPLATTVSTSAPTRSKNGEPSFTVTIRHVSTATRPICALVFRMSHICNGVTIMDPQRKYRRVGPNPTGRNEDYDPSDLEDSSLERLDIGQSLDIFYTFTVETSGIVSRPDVRKLKVGNTYRIGVRKQKWWWMFEEDLPTGATTEEVREILSKQPVCEWKPDCVDDFEVVE